MPSSVRITRPARQAKMKHCDWITRSMRKDTQEVPQEDDDVDRILRLPKDVIHRILKLMPTRDAARTSILSTKWRYIWAEHPNLVADKKFWIDMKAMRLFKEFSVDFAVDTINRMLFHHFGHINKFVLDISDMRSERHCDIDLWLSLLSRRGVKVLTLENSVSTPYILPSCVFSNSDLTNLSISNCILKTTKSLVSNSDLTKMNISGFIFKSKKYFTALNKLESLNLVNINLSSLVLVTPVLSSLTLNSCRGTRDFVISAPRLVSLTLTDNDDLVLSPFLTCSNVESAYISSVNKKLEHHGDSESINMMKLLSCWPKISKFLLDGSSLKYLTTGTVPKEFPCMLSLRRFVPFYINLNLDQIPWVLCVLQNSPVLHKFEIWFNKGVTNDLGLVNYLEEQNITNQRMEQLRVVKMKYFRASKAEVLFTKLLLRSAPSLEQMLVEEDDNLDPIERLRISKELMRLRRASTNAEIIFGPKLVPGKS